MSDNAILGGTQIGFYQKVMSLVYDPQDIGAFKYHCYALPLGNPKRVDTVWQVVREDMATKAISYPIQENGEIDNGFSWKTDDVANLTYSTVV